MNVFQLLWCVSVLIQTVVHVLYLFGIFKIFNTESTSIYVVSATYSFKVWEGGTSNFYEETNYPPLSSHPVSSGLYDLFVFFGPFDHTVFCLELESHSNPNEPGRSFPTAWWKKNALSEWIQGSSDVHCDFEVFHTCLFFGRRNVSMILLAIRKWRCDVCFTFFVFLFLPTQWCWSRSFFMLWGAWCAALLTDLKQ